MTIESASIDRISAPVNGAQHVVKAAAGSAAQSPEPRPFSDNASHSPDKIAVAVKQLQDAISSGPDPTIKLDYLSGLSVVTVRSITSGEVLFQLPDTRALELARLIKDGASLGSLGLIDTKA